MGFSLSVLVCTHNPRYDYFKRVLEALKSQTLGYSSWELIIVDNASKRSLSLEVDIAWHPHARHVREEKLGLTAARLRGIKESQSDTLIFVDDDNVLYENYLEVALSISAEWPVLGAWGGQIFPDFEQAPPEWTKPYWRWLAIREFSQDSWSNLVGQYRTTPYGAGLCVRRIVAERYAKDVSNSSLRASMDRKGNSLSSCGDIDLAFTACDCGLGTGQFSRLKVTHLIPKSRIEEGYLLKMAESMSYSSTLLDYSRGEKPTLSCMSQRIFQRYLRFRMNVRDRKFYDAKQRGFLKAICEIQALALLVSVVCLFS